MNILRTTLQKSTCKFNASVGESVDRLPFALRVENSLMFGWATKIEGDAVNLKALKFTEKHKYLVQVHANGFLVILCVFILIKRQHRTKVLDFHVAGRW